MNIYVGNLSSSTGEDKLRELFAQYGEVSSVKIIMDKFTGNPRGFAFVEMGSDDEGRQAISGLDGQEVDGKQLKVNEARPRKPRPPRRPHF